MECGLIRNYSYMNNDLALTTIDNIFLILTTVTILFLIWMIETAWRNEDRKIYLLVLIFLPISLTYYIYKYWEEMRFKCFIIVLLLIIILFISAVTKHNFTERILALLQIISIWPYYAVMALIK